MTFGTRKPAIGFVHYRCIATQINLQGMYLMLDTILITLHIIAGIAAISGGLIATVSKLVDISHTVHVNSGKAFHFGMLGVFFTALGLVVTRTNLPMFFISVFSVYFAWMGWRYAKNRKGEITQMDTIIVNGFFVFCIGMIAYAVYSLSQGDAFGNVMIPFAIIGILNARDDRNVIKNGGVKGKDRIASHLSHMLGGLIATITAVIVVNFTATSAFLLIFMWLAPTIILVPVIFIWARKIKAGTKRKGMA